MSLRRWPRAGWWDECSAKGEKDHFRAMICRIIFTRTILFCIPKYARGVNVKGGFFLHPILGACSEIGVETCMYPVKAHNMELSIDT